MTKPDSTITDDLQRIQQQVWKAAIANQDNPLGYRILDAHFAALLRLYEAWALAAVGVDDSYNNLCDHCNNWDEGRNSLRTEIRATIKEQIGEQ